ncbi:hypothetical protein [Treponema pectinovorum]|uniref:hypothetical protein n=1 Tax=Treponema pectinovorum TaxID=164 RepID=UPI0011F18F36|nr:hypothetical protein [Treponema pectinovorum]
MIIELFYKALRILTIIIVVFAVMLLLSKILPFAGDIFNSIMSFFKAVFNNLFRLFEKLKDIIAV